MSRTAHKVTYSVEPQRRARPGDAGWTICLHHQAQRFAVIQLTTWREGRRGFRKQRLMGSFSGAGAEGQANALLASCIAHARPKPSNSTPGKRFIDTGRKIIARSLTSAEYHARKED